MATSKGKGTPRRLLARGDETLNCDLTPEEVAERSERAASLSERAADCRHREAKLKGEAKSAKEEGEAFDADVRRLLTAVRTRKEQRSVPVEQFADYRRKVAETVRTDTGEVIRSRALTASELQVELIDGRRRRGTAAAAGAGKGGTSKGNGKGKGAPAAGEGEKPDGGAAVAADAGASDDAKG